jgi:cell pole-organizing protein PopZ
MSLADDIDEDLDEMDDEDIDDAFADDDLSERRRRKRRSNVKGRGYSSPRRDSSPVSQTQMQAALARVAADVRKLAASQQSLETRMSSDVKRFRTESNNSNQMAALMPFLFKPKAKTLQELTTAGELLTTKFQVESDDSLSMMLPLLMMGGMSSSGGSGGGDNNMMLMMAIALMGRK